MEFGVAAVVVFGGLLSLLPISALISALLQPHWRWETVGKSKWLWVILSAVGIPFLFGGALIGLVYWFMVHPGLKRAQPGIGFPGRV